MEIKIGVQHASRELTLESDETADAVEKQVAEALSGGQLIALTDNKGRRVLVPAERLAYLELGGGVSGQVGFRS
ncbi:MAG: DUF3107 domain-containing protein [Nocardioides sp.]